MKKVLIPLILYAYLVIREIGQLGNNLSNLFVSLRSLSILGILSALLNLAAMLVPVFALIATLFAAGMIKNEKPVDTIRPFMIPLCYAVAANQVLEMFNLVRSFTVWGFSLDIYGLLSGGLISSLLSYVTTLVLCIVVADMLKKQPKEISRKYRFVFYVVLFVMIFFGMLALISGANAFGGLLSVLGTWFLPVVFVKAENVEGVVKEATIAVIAIAIIMLISYLASDASGSSGSYSSVVPEDLQKLGVSEKEYMEIYNHYRYGTKIGN